MAAERWLLRVCRECGNRPSSSPCPRNDKHTVKLIEVAPVSELKRLEYELGKVQREADQLRRREVS